MAGKKSNKKVASNNEQENEETNFSGYFKFSESYTSLILGIVVVIIISVLLISFVKGRNIGRTSPAAPEISAAKIGPDNDQSAMLAGGTYTVKAGDDLWKISEQVYNDGYKWTEIAKANKLTSPGSISEGLVLVIPDVSKQEVVTPNAAEDAELSVTPTAQAKVEKTDGGHEKSYSVVKGDTLWDIAVHMYGDGYRWTEIASANNLANPNLIHAGNVFVIP